MTTDDPLERPLPNTDLLSMQWNLQRVVGMMGVAEEIDLANEGSTDSDSEASGHKF